MRFLILTILSMSLLFALQSAHAGSHMIWRVSVKVLLESDGSYPKQATGWPGPDRAAARRNFVNALEEGNRILAHTGQKVRLDLVEIVELDKLAGWNRANFDCGTILRSLNGAATANPNAYAFRTDAINIYVVRCKGSNGGLYPMGAAVAERVKGDIIVLHPTGAGSLLHEIGHHYGLGHTHGGTVETRDTCTNAYWLKPGNDGLSETLRDHECWSLDDLSKRSFGISYAGLASNKMWTRQRRLVDDTFGNLMSYHWASGDAANLLDQNNRPRLLAAQMNVARLYATTDRRSELRYEFRRDIDLPIGARLNANELKDRQCDLIDELQGSWTAISGFRDWITSFQFQPHRSTPKLDRFEIESSVMPKVGWYRDSPRCFSAGLHASVFSDSIMYMPNPNNGRQLTYTFRLRNSQTLEARIAGYENGSFFKRTVILRKQ